MKNLNLALTTTGLLAFALAATSALAGDGKINAPTVYGRVSAALEGTKVQGGTNEFSVKSYSSRLGFRGEEVIDQTKGQSVFYGVEAHLLSDSGSNGLGGTLRNAYLGARDKELGQIVVGRLDALVSAPLYRLFASAIPMVGYDTGNLKMIGAGGRDTANGDILASSGTSTPTISQNTQTVLARARVSNAIGYERKFGGYKFEARLTNAGPDDTVGQPGNPTGETDVRELEVAISKRDGDLFYGAGMEVDTYDSATPTDRARFSRRYQAALAYVYDTMTFGASYALNQVETDRTGVDKSGNEWAFSFKLPVFNNRGALIANYAFRDLFGTDNIGAATNGVGQPIALSGAKRTQFALGVQYDWTRSSQAYAVYNITDANDKTDGNKMTVYSMGLKHDF